MKSIYFLKKYSLVFVFITIVTLLIYSTNFIKEIFLFYTFKSNIQITEILTKMSKNTKPVAEINLSTFYNNNNQIEVLQPIINLKNREIVDNSCNENFSITDINSISNDTYYISKLQKYTNNFEDNLLKKTKLKEEQLNNYIANNIPLLNNFVTTPPLLDSFGNSFAYLLSQNGREPYNKKFWVEKNLQYFKISELKYTLSRFQITNKTFDIISRLKSSEINELINNAPIILTSSFVFIKKSQGDLFSKDNYLIFRSDEFNTQIEKTNFIVSSKTVESECLIIIGNTCWNYSAVQSYFYLRKFSSIILVLIGILFSVVLLIISKKIINKNREFYKNKLALQVLSHEFRTPISSLLLMIEKLNLNLSNFNIKEQDLITQISSEVFKLQRIVEVSKSYLQSESGNVKFNFVKIESINNWISDFVSEMNLNINSELLENDLSIKIDPFWLKFLLTNLIQNAFAHGKPPVFIRLKEANGKVKITIEDQGKCAFHSINEMTNAFVKSESSKGMGLGLNIVKYILSQCEGRIEFSSFPTTFSLILKH